MSLEVLYICLALVGLWCQFLLLRGRSATIRIVHFLIALVLWAGFFPVIFNFEKKKEIPLTDVQKGLILVDRSASTTFSDENLEDLKDRFDNEDSAGIGWFEFSDGLCAPTGKAKKKGLTTIGKTFAELLPHVEEIAPDWIWLLTDGGDTQIEHLPTLYTGLDLYLSVIPHFNSGLDYGVANIKTDPVWYVRTETSIYADIYRNKSGTMDSIDVLCLIDGVIISTQKIKFGSQDLKKPIEFTGLSKHLGTTRIEIAIAEGQGGSLLANDRLLYQCQVIRDKIRILRVVGRPTWSSKFLRDNLIKREDVDLIDFHILRSMRDRVLASNQDLALIPFPVEELFVDNISSFDLIIWQNFDSDTYPFFKRQYLLNIKRFVKKGGGLLLWAGGLPWDFSVGDFKDLAPVRNKGSRVLNVKGHFTIDEPHLLLTDRLKKEFIRTSENQLRIFSGEKSEDCVSLIQFADHTLVGIKEFEQGRVAQINSDELWNLEFNASEEHKGLYGHLVNRILLWLQKHPDLHAVEFSINGPVTINSSVDITFPSALSENTNLVWEKDGVIFKNPLQKGSYRFSINTPDRPGVYKVNLESSRHNLLVSVHSIASEYLSDQAYLAGQKKLLNLNFKKLDLNRETPWSQSGKSQKVYRNSGYPWHANWAYFIIMLTLIVIHWLIVSRTSLERS